MQTAPAADQPQTWRTHGSPPRRGRHPPPGAREAGASSTSPGAAASTPDAGTSGTRAVAEPRRQRLGVIDIPIAGLLLSIAMSVIAQAIADRQSEIDRLQAEIKALTDVEQILGASAPPSRSTSRRSSAPRKAAAAAPESKSEATPERKRRKMSAAEKKAVSERMTAYWAERKKKAAK